MASIRFGPWRKAGWEGELNRESEREMSWAGCCLWLSFIRALHLRFHVTNVRSMCSAVLFCILRNKSAVSIWVTLCTLALLPQTDPGPCHRNSHPTSNRRTQKSPGFVFPRPVFQEKEEENQKSPCAIFIWQEQKKKKKKHKQYGEYVLMPQIHAGGGAALSATAPRKTSKAHLHARVVRHLYCILTFTKWRRKNTCVFQIVIMGIDSQTNMIQNELSECSEQ